MDRKGRFQTKSSILTQSKRCLFNPNFFDRAIRSTHPVEKVDFFNGMHESDCPIETVFEAHRISHRPRKHTIAPYNSSVAGLTATAAAAAAVLALATLDEVQRRNRDDETGEGFPCAQRTLCSRKRRDEDVCLSTASSWMQTDPLEHASRTRRSSFQQNFACPTPAYQTPS